MSLPPDAQPLPASMKLTTVLFCWTLWSGLCGSFVVPLFADERIDFNREIRPILSENCFQCHGPDADSREADLRLDQQDGALRTFEPGHRDQSELFARVSSDDPDLRMPPAESNKQLTAAEIELLGQWITQGAAWGQHWSWTPIHKPDVPEFEPFSEIPVRNPIDAFIQARLRKMSLQPASEATKVQLLRRVTLDLTGLPPTPDDVKAFLQDESESAYENVIDRLLDSNSYGERMAWDWLDAARYADTNGYQGDRERTMWPWRDWVVDAFNQNLSYDQFTIWQIAGDLLPDATFEQKLATGFCRNHMINGEGGRIPEENRVDYVMDMSETVGTLWLGLTLNCCRCHDHKFDPLTQTDYFQMFAFFNQTPVDGGGGDPQSKPVLAAPTSAESARREELLKKISQSKTELTDRAVVLTQVQSDWERQKLASLRESITWHPLVASSLKAVHQHLEQFPDRSIFASGENPPNDTYELTAAAPIRNITGLRLDVLKHVSHFNGALARSNSGNFVLTEIEVVLIDGDSERPVMIADAQATYEQGGLKVTSAFDGKPDTGWAVHEGKPVDREHAAVFRFAEPLKTNGSTQLKISLRHDSPHVSHNIGRFRISVTDQSTIDLEDHNQRLLLALHTGQDQRTDEQRTLIASAQQAEDTPYQALAKQLETTQQALNNLEKGIAKVMIMEDIASPRQSFILDRGLYNAPGDEVFADVPASLPTLPVGTQHHRLALARWLVSPENPLTARVVVNRFWQQLFGIGLVKTVQDFGTQGEVPIHQDLLDWLAADFRDSGWDVKRLMKQIVMSHTYRQSSKMTQEVHERDPENRLLAHGARFRLPSWMLRDQALAVSGLLVDRRGGPSVNVYQPPGVWEEATFGNKKYQQDHGESLYRRSLYIFWRRIIGPTVFFDNASRQTCTVKVFRTNTPLHSLLTLNDTTYVEAARTLAQRVLQADLESDEARLDNILMRTLSRNASQQERAILLAGLNRSREEFKTDPAAAKEFLSIGESPRDEAFDPVEHASWAALCLAVLNLDETLTKE